MYRFPVSARLAQVLPTVISRPCAIDQIFTEILLKDPQVYAVLRTVYATRLVVSDEIDENGDAEDAVIVAAVVALLSRLAPTKRVEISAGYQTRKHSQTNALNVQKRVKQLELAFLVHVQLQPPPSEGTTCYNIIDVFLSVFSPNILSVA